MVKNINIPVNIEVRVVNQPKILIVGHARHGKDSVAQILADGWGFSFESSSWAACEKVILPFSQGEENYNRLPIYTNTKECFDDRVNFRSEWKRLITEYNKDDKTRLAREILENNNVYVGMRCKYELAACASKGLFDVIVWVDGGYRKEPEPLSSNTITENMTDYSIDNNGDIKDLIQEVFKFMKWYNRVGTRYPIEQQKARAGIV